MFSAGQRISDGFGRSGVRWWYETGPEEVWRRQGSVVEFVAPNHSIREEGVLKRRGGCSGEVSNSDFLGDIPV